MKKNPELAAYMNCSAEEGLDLDRFVEHGSRILTVAEIAGLTDGLDDLQGKIATLKVEHSKLAGQLELLADFYRENPPGLPAQVRTETIFALLYALKDVDLVPDNEPGVGYLDDAAVAESVLARHAGIFENHCYFRQIEWATVAPGHLV
jgi:uncharacterized membrane protein YkvA (DUF1232 family)